MKKEKIIGLANRLKKEGDEEASMFLRGIAEKDEGDKGEEEKKGLSDREMDLLTTKLQNSLASKKDSE